MSTNDDNLKGASPGKTTATQLAVCPQVVPAQPQQLPRYRLLLHNDDVNTMDDVVRGIVKLTPLNPAEALRRMLEAHHAGVSLLLATHKERGELYVDQFASLRITTSLEPEV